MPMTYRWWAPREFRLLILLTILHAFSTTYTGQPEHTHLGIFSFGYHESGILQNTPW
nr:hypothetical protein Q903MT_gene5325 [Picea sitchensis]